MSFANPSGIAILARSAVRLLFGQCVFDRGSRELLREGLRQDLSPKAFQFLDLLLRARPRAVTKQQIHDQLWPDAFVSDSSLPRLAAEVRAAIGDDAKKPRLLRTVHRYGYAFFGTVQTDPVEGPAGASSGRLLWGERQFPLPQGESILGRSADARVWIDLARVSRHHARIVVDGERTVLEDLGSKNGTFLRGQRINGPSELVDGDEICIGPVVLVFRTSQGDGTTQTGTVA
jgi:DNA-binding winged helix-turn-helix (wHTH) protein